MSTSRILDSVDCKLVAVTVKLLIVEFSLFCSEPNLDLSDEIVATAVSIDPSALVAAFTLVTSRPYKPSASAMSLTLGYGSQGQQSGDGASPSKPGA